MNSPRIRRLRLHMVALKGLASSVVLALTILGLGGVGFWWIDPQGRSELGKLRQEVRQLKELPPQDGGA